MDYSVNKPNSWLREIQFHIPVEEVQQKVNEKISAIRKNVSIPGFRKGKAPADVIRLRFGKAILEEVLEDALNDAYWEVVKKENLLTVSSPEAKEQNWDETEGLSGVIEVQVEPEIELEKYTGLKLTKEIHEVTDEEIEETIQRLREENAAIQAVEDGAQEGDYVKAEIQEVSESGVPIVGQREEKEIRLGDKAYGEEFDKGLLGVKKDEERRVSGVLSAQPDLKRHYSVRVKDVVRHILPDVTDDFAKDLGDYESLEDLRNKIRRYLELEYERRANEALLDGLVNALINENPFEVPPAMVDTYLDAYVEDVKKQLKSDFDVDAFKEAQKPVAIREIKWYLIKKKIAELENIQVTDEEIDQYIENLAKSTGQSERKLKAKYSLKDRRNRLVNDLRDKKIIDFLLEKSEIEEVELQASESDIVDG